MSEPDDLTEFLRRARSEEEPTPEDCQAVRRGIHAHWVAAGLAATSATLVAKTGIAAQGSILASVASYAAVGFTVGALSMAVLGTLREPAPPSATLRKPLHRVESPASPPVTVRPVATAEAPSPAVPEENTRVPDPNPPLAPTMIPLLKEARGLADIQRALRDDRPLQALQLLEEQERVFRGGALDAERAAARVLALCEAGRNAEAREATARFLAAHPNSPVTARVAESCGKN